MSGQTGQTRAVLIGLITSDVLVSVPGAGTSASVMRSYGGILHSVAALAAHRINLCVVSLGTKRDMSQIQKLMIHYAHVDLSHVQAISSSLPECCLVWAPGGSEPIEHTTTHERSITVQQVNRALRGDAEPTIYLNFMIGHDVEVSTVMTLARRGVRIFLDPHMFLYRRDSSGARLLDPPIGWEELLLSAEYIQLSCSEFDAIARQLDYHGSRRVGVRRLMEYLARCEGRVRGLVVTSSCEIIRGLLEGHRISIRSWKVDRITQASPFMTIGCGDTFGAGVFAGLMESWGPVGFDRGIEMGIVWARSAAAVNGIAWGHIDLERECNHSASEPGLTYA